MPDNYPVLIMSECGLIEIDKHAWDSVGIVWSIFPMSGLGHLMLCFAFYARKVCKIGKDIRWHKTGSINLDQQSLLFGGKLDTK